MNEVLGEFEKATPMALIPYQEYEWIVETPLKELLWDGTNREQDNEEDDWKHNLDKWKFI